MSGVRRLLVYRLPVLLYMGLIFYLSSGPVPSSSLDRIPDYYLHSMAYCGLCVLMFWAVHEGCRVIPGRGGFWLPALLSILYGITDELHQSFIPSRDASVLDLMANTAGASMGGVLMLAAGRMISGFRPGRDA